MSSSKKNVEICHKEDVANEFNEVKQEIAKFRVGEFSGSDWKEDDRMDERKKANGNLQSVESIGPIVLMFLYIFFYLLNFV